MPDSEPLAPPRRRALAELDARIAEAEAVRARHLTTLRAAPTSGAVVGAVRAIDARLTLLRQSRAALAGWEQAAGPL
jgi:hypothetical protein